MTLVRCPGCNRKFKIGGSLSTHQRKCLGLKAKAKDLFKKREENRNAKIAHQELEHPQEEDDDVAQIRADLRERLNPFNTEELHNGKRKMAERKAVSVCVTSQL